jgi:ribonucleoside-diphosphate reductase alpha chain
VFDTSMGAQAIHYMGHVRMMAGVQPFISGAISKTVNMPEDATVEEVEQLFVEGWKLGLKAVAIYRDNCKVAQPLSAEKKGSAQGADAALVKEIVVERPVRKRLPASRPARTVSFRVGESEGYITAGEYPADGIGEIFLKVSKQGSTLSGVMDAFAIAVSLGLQYGVPLEAFVEKFINMRFDPSGMTNDPDIRFASSLMDYNFRRMALEYLPDEKRLELGVRSIAERKQDAAASNGTGHAEVSGTAGAGAEPVTEVDAPTMRVTPKAAAPMAKAVDAPFCYSCGSKMQAAGSCYVCTACGSTSGCS